MKKILAVLICFVMLVCITACGSPSNSTSNSTSGSTSAPKPQVKFYEGTQIPTFDSVSMYGIKCTGNTSNIFTYGTYDNSINLQIDISRYVEFVEEEYGYKCEYLNTDKEDSVHVQITSDQGTLLINSGLTSGVVVCMIYYK